MYYPSLIPTELQYPKCVCVCIVHRPSAADQIQVVSSLKKYNNNKRNKDAKTEIGILTRGSSGISSSSLGISLGSSTAAKSIVSKFKPQVGLVAITRLRIMRDNPIEDSMNIFM